MSGISSYILSVVCAAILCAVLTSLSGEKGISAPIRKLICGIFLCFSVIAPLRTLDYSDFLEPMNDIRQDALATAAMGQTLYQESLTQVITENTEAYILDKAKGLGLSLSVTVHPDDSGKPFRVTLAGNAGEMAREALTDILESELGIPKERQIWIAS